MSDIAEAVVEYGADIAVRAWFCGWRKIFDGCWGGGDFYNTDCGNAHQFMTDGLTENKFSYCPYCGRVIKEITEKA